MYTGATGVTSATFSEYLAVPSGTTPFVPAPQAAQYFAPGSFDAPQAVQNAVTIRRSAPQAPQKAAASGLSAEHVAHVQLTWDSAIVRS
jgi:hypothetical protein